MLTATVCNPGATDIQTVTKKCRCVCGGPGELLTVLVSTVKGLGRKRQMEMVATQ